MRARPIRSVPPVRPVALAAALLTLGMGVSACGAGSGAGVPLPSGGQQEPGTTPAEPGTTGAEPGTTGAEPGGSGEPTGGGPVSGGSCLACISYECTLVVNGSKTTLPITLTPAAGGCAVSGSSLLLRCGGAVIAPGGQGDAGSAGNWQPTAGAGFTLPTSDGTFTCAPL
jgi:hypothetical protein